MSKTYQVVTDRIVAMLEAGTAPWRRPWVDGMPDTAPVLGRPLRSNGKAYTGANVPNLWAASLARGFSSPYWFTYKGAQEIGANVRKGAKSELAFYVGKTTVKSEESDSADRTISFLKSYCVFNADEVEGLPAQFYAPAPITAPVARHEKNPAVESFAANTAAHIRHGGNKAFYAPSTDHVQMPWLDQFDCPAAYYSTLLHELAHWTSHSGRCARELGRRFGDSAYAAEELVAELAAAFLCADLGLSNEPRPDHAAYIASWIGVLKNDNRAIFRAASLAEKASAFLHNLQSAEAIPVAA